MAAKTQSNNKNLIKMFEKLISGLPQGFLKQLSWQYIATISVVIFGFINTILIANKLGATQLGIIALASGIATITAQFFNLSIKDIVIRYVNIFLSNGRPETAHNLVITCVLVNIITALVYFLLILLMSPFLNDLLIKTANGPQIIRLYSLVLIFQILLPDSILGYIRLRHALHVYAGAQLFSSALRLVITFIGLWYFQMGIFFVVMTTVLTGFITLGILSFKTVKLLSAEKHTAYLLPWKDIEILELLPEIKRFLRNNYFTGILSIPAKELDMNLLGIFTTTENVGIYKIAKNFISAIWAITDPVHLVIYPECSKFWANNDQSGLRIFIKKITLMLLISSICIILGSALVVPFFIHSFVGAEFSFASTLFIIMVSSTIIWIPLLWIQPIFLTAARTDLALKASFVHSITSLLLYVGFIALYGTLGAAIAYAINAAIIAGLQFYLLSKNSVLHMNS